MTITGKFILIIFVTVLVFLGIAGLVLIPIYRWSTGTGGLVGTFTGLAGYWALILATSVTAIVSVFTAYRQGLVKHDLMQLTGQLERDLIILNNRLSASREAYDELNAAATTYYHTLALLEMSHFDGDKVMDADYKMIDASRYLVSVTDEDEATWYEFWQAARSIHEKASAIESESDLLSLWHENVKRVSEPLEQFREAARSELTVSSSDDHND